jgi:hypothetical protein
VGKNFHESYFRGEIKPPSERATGFAFAMVALLVAAWWRHQVAVALPLLTAAALLAILSMAMPRFLKPLNMAWFRFGLLLHRIVNPLAMLALFALVFVPAGLVMRIWRDPLKVRRTNARTYWIERKPDAKVGSMVNQF